jgi:hypothetical protein
VSDGERDREGAGRTPADGVAALRERYAEVFDEATTTSHVRLPVRRIAWRLQALAEGDLSERTKQRATELARDADLRVVPREKPSLIPVPAVGRTMTREVAPVSDGRLPPPGSVITHKYSHRPLERHKFCLEEHRVHMGG